VDRGMAPGAAQLSDIVNRALEAGRYPVKQAEGDFAVKVGQVRLGGMTIQGTDADLSASGNLDLTAGSFNARLVLSGHMSQGEAHPEIFVALHGPLGSPMRDVDVSALTGWLTLRAIENQSKQLKQIEAAQPIAPVPPPKPKAIPSPQQAPALPAPVDIKPLPIVPQRAKRPEASVGGAQH